MKRIRLKNYDWNRSVAISYVIAIFVVRKSYKTQKAQDLVGLVLFWYIEKTIDRHLDNREWWETIISGEYRDYYGKMYGNG